MGNLRVKTSRLEDVSAIHITFYINRFIKMIFHMDLRDTSSTTSFKQNDRTKLSRAITFHQELRMSKILYQWKIIKE